MVAALDYLGYSSDQINPSSAIPENGDFLGLLLNLGVVQGKPKHWIALRFKSRASNGTVTYTLYDSLHAAPSETTLATYLKRHPNVYTIKVMLPKGQPTHPYERIDILPYPEGMQPGGTPPIYGMTATPVEWIEKESASKKAKYWYNPVTGESRWTNPKGNAATTKSNLKPAVLTGLYSLNKLLGEEAFALGKEGDILPSPRVKPVSLFSICGVILPQLQKSTVAKYKGQVCSPSLADSSYILTGALNSIGYLVYALPPGSRFEDTRITKYTQHSFVGLLVDIGKVTPHWVALKNEQTEGITATLFDSAETEPVPNVQYQEFLDAHPKRTTTLVVSAFPHGEQSPLWGYVEPTPTKAEMEQCKTFYDPCTKESIGSDPAVLEARIKEILAKKGGTRRSSRQGKRKTRKH
jgi:hypothetical protein